MYKNFARCGAIAALSVGVLQAGCGGDTPQGGAITEVAPAHNEDTRYSAPVTTKERLRVQDMVAPGGSPHGDNPHAAGSDPHAGLDMPATAAASPYSYTVPEGWSEAPAAPMRAVNLKISDATECYVSVLGGDGGGLASNLNRWRKQMGQPDLSDAEIAALPKRPFLGGEASFIQIDGDFTGMGAAGAQPNYRMLGLALVTETQAVFVKLTGPQAEAEAQTANFDAFCASLKDGGAAPAAQSVAPASAPMPATAAAAPAAVPAPAIPATTAASSVPMPTFDATKLQWNAPPSWVRGAERMMRVVTYTVGGAECYITVLDGPAGGIEANLNRWRGQMSQPALSADEVAALPKIPVLGKEAQYMEAKGTFTSMSGQVLEGQMMLGIILMMDNGLLTVKMTGPEADVLAETESFKAFCSSISMS